MTRSHSPRILHRRAVVAVIAAASLAVTFGVTVASGASHAHAKGVVITAFKSAKYGTVLSDGTTLYTLKPNATTCTSTCHKYWIPVLLPKGVTKASAGAGVSAVKLGTLKVTGGEQVTYGGKALFWFYLDKSSGQVKGDVTDTWGKWSDVVLVKPAGKPSTTTPTTVPTSTTQPPTTTTTVKTTPTTTTTAPSGGGGVGF